MSQENERAKFSGRFRVNAPCQWRLWRNSCFDRKWSSTAGWLEKLWVSFQSETERVSRIEFFELTGFFGHELKMHTMWEFTDIKMTYMAHVSAGKQGEIIWAFNRSGEFDFACLLPGNDQVGMVGKFKVAVAGNKATIGR